MDLHTPLFQPAAPQEPWHPRPPPPPRPPAASTTMPSSSSGYPFNHPGSFANAPPPAYTAAAAFNGAAAPSLVDPPPGARKRSREEIEALARAKGAKGG